MQADYAAAYGELESWHWWFRGRQRILEAVLRRAFAQTTLPGPRSIVSVGSGPPSGIAWLTPFAGEDGLVIGLDADPSGALRAAAAGQPAPARVQLVAGTMENPPLRRHAAHAVLALDVIEHLDDDAGGLVEAASLVAPGGFLLVTVPALPSLWGAQDTVNHHRRRYTRRSLADAFARAKLAAPRLTFFNTLLFPPIAAVRWTRRLLRRAPNGRSDFDGARPGLQNNIFEEIFAAERAIVTRGSLPFGVSLLGLLRC
jgi:SAM-dependent methyltransferase